jgi:glycosyltransferase involved in cell wall biosynthesis
MKRTIHIAHSAPGGASDLATTLAVAGQSAGCPQSVVFWGKEAPWQDRLDRCHKHGITTAAFAKPDGISPLAHLPLCQWLKQQQDCAAIVLHYHAALFAVKAAFTGPDRPQVLVVEHRSNACRKRQHWWQSRISLMLADGVVYLTDQYRHDLFAKLKVNPSPRKHAVIANGIDLDRYAPSQARPPVAGRCVFGMSAMYVPHKDHATLIAAFADLVRRNPSLDLTLELAGDGPGRSAVEAQVTSFGIQSQVKLLGALPQDELISRMWTWDVNVLSSFGETQSISILEAMAAQLPVIGTKVAGIFEAVTHETEGLLVPPQDIVGLSDAMCRLATDLELRTQLGQAGLDRVAQRHSIEFTWQGYQRFIDTLTPHQTTAFPAARHTANNS